MSVRASFTSPGGVHPAYHKDLAMGSAIAQVPLPPLLIVSMAQHLGKPATPTVKKGDAVRRGDVIGSASGFISAAVHAPTSGTVKALSDQMTPAGQRAPAIELEPDGEDSWGEPLPPMADWANREPREIVDRVADAGIAGMGGAGFPTHVKLNPPPEKPIDTLILNGAECEPYLTADYRLMLERAAEIWEGAGIIRKALGAGQCFIAIEDNKPEAIACMEGARPSDSDAVIAVLPTEYPQGAEKQQIYAIAGREVPAGGLPLDIGCVVENVGTTLAIREAVINGRPLTERVTTVTGLPVRNPGNVLARLGTSYATLLEFCGGTTGPVAKVISGGPMMGFAQADMACTTSKTTSGLLFLPPGAVSQFASMPCISCGRCLDACPMNLMPNELSQFLEAEDYDSAEAYNVMDCIECGCCAFECPAHRPLVQHMKSGKAFVMAKRRRS